MKCVVCQLFAYTMDSNEKDSYGHYNQTVYSLLGYTDTS